ncbi:hypothetical protein IIQ44_15810 [Acinetobacter oleivorans]|uniref:hypothetical protein n=1 Tax=Acinetobacter oleivorans TaxID=1148157 RepID=UPI00178CF401|nr:hypothetical protein [Acinetobacter oleivorans]MBE2173363.1 hypothetical protein [Acinetobacter oleivorans]MDY7374501.1 hypothetical protein [Acinetobacter oleivorans]
MKFLLCVWIFLLFGCTSKNIDSQSTDINFGKFKYFQSMYSGEKTYQGFVTSSSSLKEISEKKAFPISKLNCLENQFMVRGGVDLDSEEINNQLYKYMARVEICKNDDCSVDIKKAKIDTECRIELRKNYSSDTYQSNKAKLTNANFE